MANKYLQLQRKLLEAVQNVRDDPDLCDVTFLVGKLESERRQIHANSTILALRSPYFKAMCFGPLKRSSEVKVLPDMEPEVFEKVLSFVHAGDDSLSLASLEEAWDVRYAASQFLLQDLVQVCEDYLQQHLTHKNALKLLRQAAAFRADEFKRKVFRVIKHRHRSVLSSPDLRLLELQELLDVMKLFRHVRTDYILRAVSIWGEGLSAEDDFKQVFRSKLFKHIRWDNLSNENMLKLHEVKMLSLELENEAMISILSRTDPLPEEEVRTICNLELQIGKSKNQKRPTIRRLWLRTLRSYQRNLTSIWCKKEVSVVLDYDGMGVLKDVLKMKPLQGIAVDRDDVDVLYAINHAGKVHVEDLKAVVYHIRHDNKDVFFFELTFAEIALDSGSNGEASSSAGKNVDTLMLEVAFAPELLRDLLDFNLQSSTLLTKVEKVSTESLEVVKKTWQTFSNGKLVLSNDDTTPRYFFDGCGVPVISQVN